MCHKTDRDDNFSTFAAHLTLDSPNQCAAQAQEIIVSVTDRPFLRVRRYFLGEAALSEKTWRCRPSQTEEGLSSATEWPSVRERRHAESHNVCLQGLFLGQRDKVWPLSEQRAVFSLLTEAFWADAVTFTD